MTVIDSNKLELQLIQIKGVNWKSKNKNHRKENLCYRVRIYFAWFKNEKKCVWFKCYVEYYRKYSHLNEKILIKRINFYSKQIIFI